MRYNCQPGNAAVITRIMSVPTNNNCHLSNNHDQCNCDCSNNCKCCNVFQVIRHLKVGKTIAINCTKSKVQAGNYFEILLGNTRDTKCNFNLGNIRDTMYFLELKRHRKIPRYYSVSNIPCILFNVPEVKITFSISGISEE